MKHVSIHQGGEILLGADGLARRAKDSCHNLQSARVMAENVNAAEPTRWQDRVANYNRVREILKLRRRRDKFFAAELFADPAWDILLELYAAELGQHRVTVSNLCVGAAVPATTALRWINHLENRGLIIRTADPIDGRRAYLSLSSTALADMENFFSAVQDGGTIV